MLLVFPHLWGEFLLVDWVHRSCYYPLNRVEFLSILGHFSYKRFGIVEIVKEYRWFYMNIIAYKNLCQRYYEELQLSESIVRHSAFLSVLIVGCLLDIVLLWVR